jgi:7,8-dihydropterin-6-yl-methyl-4-(beta-D-ribofuranosyl)aminobenzene 5'-phosphate synthase
MTWHGHERRTPGMNIKILYDNQAKQGFQYGWGFSALIDDTILFDTGESVDPLLLNIRAFNVDAENINRVVLSHEDWDHVGGVAIIKKFCPVTV